MTKSLRVATSIIALFTMLTLVACERANDKGTRSNPGPPASGANNPKNTPGGTANSPANQPGSTGPRSTTPPP